MADKSCEDGKNGCFYKRDDEDFVSKRMLLIFWVGGGLLKMIHNKDFLFWMSKIVYFHRNQFVNLSLFYWGVIQIKVRQVVMHWIRYHFSLIHHQTEM